MLRSVGGGDDRKAARWYLVNKARGGVGLGGGHGDDTWWCGGGGDDRGGDWSSSLIFLEQPLEREDNPFFLQMTAWVCGGGGVPSPLIEPIMGREGKGHLRPTTHT